MLRFFGFLSVYASIYGCECGVFHTSKEGSPPKALIALVCSEGNLKYESLGVKRFDPLRVFLFHWQLKGTPVKVIGYFAHQKGGNILQKKKT